MAKRGAKPKPAHLHLVAGTRNATRHGSEDELRRKVDASTKAFGQLTKPSYLTGEAAKAWKNWIVPAGWLDSSREAAAIAFCELWKEFRFNPAGFAASKHAQLRFYMAELGLTDERNRGDVTDERDEDSFFED